LEEYSKIINATLLSGRLRLSGFTLYGA